MLPGYTVYLPTVCEENLEGIKFVRDIIDV